METARNVLDSDEVQQAIADHGDEAGDGLTDEQRAYMEFVKNLDAKDDDGEESTASTHMNAPVQEEDVVGDADGEQ